MKCINNFMQLSCFVSGKLDFVATYSRIPHIVLSYQVISMCKLYRAIFFTSECEFLIVCITLLLFISTAREIWLHIWIHALALPIPQTRYTSWPFLNKRERPFIKTYQRRSNDQQEMQKRHQILKMKPILGYVLRLFSRRACSIFYCLRRVRLWILNSWISLHLLSCPPLSFLTTRIESILSCTNNSMTVRAVYK